MMDDCKNSLVSRSSDDHESFQDRFNPFLVTEGMFLSRGKKGAGPFLNLCLNI